MKTIDLKFPLLTLACAAALLAIGCTTPTRNPGGYARIIQPNLLAPPALEARVALERDAAGEVANVDIRPVLGLGLGVVGVRLTIFPVEMAFGAVDFPFGHGDADREPPPRRAPARKPPRD